MGLVPEIKMDGWMDKTSTDTLNLLMHYVPQRTTDPLPSNHPVTKKKI